MENTFSIANYFIQRGIDSNKSVTPMKLQKLIYFAHGWYWAIKNEPLIDESVEAWKYGPVIPSVYHAFKHYGTDSIKSLKTDIWSRGAIVTNPETIEILELVW